MVDVFCHVPSSHWSAAVSACAAITGENGSTIVHITDSGVTLNANDASNAVAVRLRGKTGSGHARRTVRTADLAAEGAAVVTVGIDDDRLTVRDTQIAGRKAVSASSSTPKFRANATLGTISIEPAAMRTLLTAVSGTARSKRPELNGKLLLAVGRTHDGAAEVTASAAGMFAAVTSTVRGELGSDWRSATTQEGWVHGPAVLAASSALDIKAQSWQLSIATTGTHHRVTLSDGSVQIISTIDASAVPDVAGPLSKPSRARYWDLDIAELPTLVAFLERLPKPLDGTSPFAQIRNDRGGDGTPHQAQITVHINGLVRKCTAKSARRRDGVVKGITTTCAEDVAVDVPLAQLQALIAAAEAHRSSSLLLRGYAPHRTMSKLFAFPCPDSQGAFTAVTIGRVPIPT